MASRVTGAREVAADIRASIRAVPLAIGASLKKLQTEARALVIDRTVQRYNLRVEKIAPLVTARPSEVPANAKSVSIDIRIKAAAIENFDPRVHMIQANIRSRSGRSFTRLLPSIEVSLYRNKPLRPLAGAFPLHRRADGRLGPNDRVRARIGRARDKLKRFRYVTFPRALLDPIIKEAQDLAGEGFTVTFTQAFRNARGRLVRN